MGAVVVYESMYGNTFQVATAVAEGIRDVMPVDLVEVGHAPRAEELSLVDLLVVGAPTHAFGLSRPATRQEAAKRTEHGVISLGCGVREWLDAAWPAAIPAAAFDTHTVKPDLPGHAGKAIERRLHAMGGRVLTKYASFRVAGYEGPLSDGKLARARSWGAYVATLASRTPISV